MLNIITVLLNIEKTTCITGILTGLKIKTTRVRMQEIMFLHADLLHT